MLIRFSNKDPIGVFRLETMLVVGFFFFNTFLLPAGLLYTSILMPLFILLLLRRNRWRFFFWYLLFTVLLGGYHLGSGAETGTYVQSYLLFTSAVIFGVWGYFYLRENAGKLSFYFREITIYNAFFTGLALVALFIPLVRNFFWSFVPLHPDIPVIPRLKLLVYEPSFYALQLAPVFVFYFLSFVFSSENQDRLPVFLLFLSLLLSLSFGVIGGLCMAILLIFFLHAFRLLRRPRIFWAAGYLSVFVAAGIYLALQYFPFNPVFERLELIFAGYDTSANGRTWEAFLMAWKILGETSYLFGAGLGQIKEVGHEIIVNYYNYVGADADVVRIPNAMAETLATFGIIGVLVRGIGQIVLFVVTRVYENYYRLVLFAFIFIYQFTGSYLTNIYEYLIWVIVFLPVFPQFDKRQIHAS
jgi:hypothetical protein